MKIAFIGGHGHHYLRGLLQNPAFETEFAVASDGCDEQAARGLLDRLRLPGRAAPAYFESPRAILDGFAPDIVSIGAVYGHNGTLAALALERDLAVVCDKPIAANREQLERLRDLARGNNRVLLTEFPFRCQSEFRAARAAVRHGRIGELVLATAQKSYRFGASRPAWYRDAAAYPGTLLWVASHGIDAIAFCGGAKFSRVLSVGGNLSQPNYGANFEDHVVALFQLSSGATALVHADFLRPQGAKSHGDDRLRLAGTRGILEVQGGRCHLIDSEGESDITDEANGAGESRSIEAEFLAAIAGEADTVYSTAQSLEIAEVLLRAREAQGQAQGEAGWTDMIM